MKLLFHFLQTMAILVFVAGHCTLFGHSCLGAHGKRTAPSNTGTIANARVDPLWPIYNRARTAGADPILERKTKPVVEALPDDPYLNFSGPSRYAERSRFSSEDFDN